MARKQGVSKECKSTIESEKFRRKEKKKSWSMR